MLRFLRLLRRKLLAENRFSKYLLYAVGEIVLVVIGILIALQINNWNEERKNSEKVKTILADMMIELETDIKETTRLMKFYERKDSTIFLSISNELTEENFKKNIPDNLFSLTLYYNKAFFNTEAWTKLMDMSDVVSDEFKPLGKKLNRLYNVRYEAVMGKNDIMGQITDEYVYYQTDTYSWFTPKSINDGSLDKQIDHYLNSFKHRNRIRLWHIQGVQNHLHYIINYRKDAIDVYNDIKNLLDSTSHNKEIYFDEELAQSINGNWRSDRFPDYEINFNYDEGRLFLKFNQDTISREIFDMSEGKLIQHPFIWYYEIEQENWRGNYPIAYYTIIHKDDELILKDYFSEWRKVTK